MSLKVITSFLITFFCLSECLTAQGNGKDSTAYQYFERADHLFYDSPDSAFYYYNKAKKIFKKDLSWEYYVHCLNGLANYHYLGGNFQQLEQNSLEAIEIAEKHLDGTSEAYTNAVNNFGIYFKRKGDYRRALEYYKKTLDLELKHSTNKLDIATSYNNIAVALSSKGDYKEAIDHFIKALDFQRDTVGENGYPVARTYLMLGNNYIKYGDPEKALNYYQDFLKIALKDGTPEKRLQLSDLISCYQSICKMNIDKGNYEMANQYIQKAMALKQTDNPHRKIQSYEILGLLNTETGNLQKALEDYKTAAQLAEEMYANHDKHITKARTQRRIGNAFIKLGKYEKALEHFQEALILLAFDYSERSVYSNPLSDRFILKTDGLKIIERKAAAFYKKYQQESNLRDLEAALENYNFAAQLIDELRQSYLSQGSKLTLAEKTPHVYEGGIKTSVELFNQGQDQKFLEQAFTFAEKNKAMLLLESIQNNEAISSSEIPKEEIEKERELRVNITFYEKEINRQRTRRKKMDTEKVREWQNHIFELRQQHNELIKHFDQEYAGYFKLKHNSSIVSIAELRDKILVKNTALLEYFTGKEKVYIFSISLNELKVFSVDLQQGLEKMIQDMRAVLTHPPQSENFLSDCNHFGEHAVKLSEVLLHEPLQNLSANIDRLIIIPDGTLSYLPFEILLTKTPQENPTNFSPDNFNYLLLDYSISYAYSATLLANYFKVENQKTLNPFIGFAPSFGKKMAGNMRGCTDNEIYTLHCNQQEVESINDLFGGNTVTGKDANISSFLTQAENYRIVHLATHACSDDEEVSQNKIWFTDGYLSNTELNNLRLNSELVVLSACETGTGKLAKGEGILSLSRGFIIAGCSSTLTSLWSVDDCTTSDIMTGFYKFLAKGFSKDTALRQAKIEHFAKADNAKTHPYYWAAFIQSGNTESIHFSSGFSKKWLWLALPFILLLAWRWKKYQSS